jgi:hypothetical protein
MKIENKEDAVTVLNILNDKGVVKLQPNRLGFDYVVRATAAQGIAGVAASSDVRLAKQALSVMMGGEIAGFEGSAADGGYQWHTGLDRAQAQSLLESGVEVPQKTEIMSRMAGAVSSRG